MGGNKIKGKYFQKSYNLHQLWDTQIIYTRMDDDFSRSYDKMTDYLIGRVTGDLKSKAEQWRNFKLKDSWGVTWADESNKLACSHAYVDEKDVKIQSGFYLAEAYYKNNIETIEEQLVKAGVRLAALLNDVLG